MESADSKYFDFNRGRKHSTNSKTRKANHKLSDNDPRRPFMDIADDLIVMYVRHGAAPQDLLNEATSSVQDSSTTRGLPWLFYTAIRYLLVTGYVMPYIMQATMC
ncbi:hypothetical protein AAE478_009968 [Parahypoxylon ruwenzoriense]